MLRGNSEGIPDLCFFIEARPGTETWKQKHEEVDKCVKNGGFPQDEGWWQTPGESWRWQIIERKWSMVYLLPEPNQQEKAKEWFNSCLERIEQTKILQI
ncbi:hypothetical protein CH333_03060 [candidate division WOR-3 bacterium JGI_Cruoil_03_44_89]|uniref:Uncharacterized protein n=1 Tax=candidate division WOR-3 bacterium JGI_Cruoil_03_44_89 TaxID=1973748 RepID=A0A235BYF0_UNCW3|nr:MAG: hypothetical protein CH333_03060 [candidate division WOR-3 bacterium JGI_Cruoil_03_44_89]